MVKSITLGHRTAMLSALLAMACLVSFILFWGLTLSLRNSALYSGTLIYLLILFLTLFNARKKLPFLPLFKASSWLQCHIYTGFFIIFLFAIHINWRVPSGYLETILAVIFLIVSISGIVGLCISRALPQRMQKSGENLIFERIPTHYEQIKQEVIKIVRKAELENESLSLSRFYFYHLRSFLERRPSVLYVFYQVDKKFIKLLQQVKWTQRFLDEQELKQMEEITILIEEKRNIDYQFSATKLLRYWLFIHIPFSYSLIIIGLVHGVTAFLYSG